MFFVFQINPPNIVLALTLLINELIALWRNGWPAPGTDTCNRPWCSSGSGYAPQTGEPSTYGREHDIATVRSPTDSWYEAIIKGQPFGCAARGGRKIKGLPHARNNRSGESPGWAIGGENRTKNGVLK